MSVITWVVQLLLAVVFALGGFMKLTMPLPELGRQLAWAGDLPAWLVRFIGLSELAGAVGLVLPAATGIRPRLTTLAALGLALIMVLAMAFHMLRWEFQALPINLVLGSLAAFVGWSRFTGVPPASNHQTSHRR